MSAFSFDKKIRVLLAEDHQLVRDGLKWRLAIEDNIDVVGEAADGHAVIGQLKSLTPDLLLLDLGLPGISGEELVTIARTMFPQLKILVLTGNIQADAIARTLAAGANAYITKQDNYSELIKGIETVMHGGTYIAASIVESVASFNTHSGGFEAQAISMREREVLRMVAAGRSTKDIANELGLAVATVRKHRENVMGKLKLRNSAEVTVYAMQNGLFAPNAPSAPNAPH